VNETEFQERVARVRAAVASAAERADRDPASVCILPVTKGFPPGVLGAVAAAGFRSFGENRVGEAEAKREEVGDLGVAWEMIGHLQRNKAARGVRLFDRVDSVDSLRLARRLDAAAEAVGRPDLPVLVQVNASGEAAKGGLPVDEAVRVIEQISALPRVRVEGLMTMAPFGASECELREVFARTRGCLEACRERIPGFTGDELSMGMSGDFEIAIREGATQVRLGTALLGERPGFA
jgi:pyridoxal phosphate enzyme (YggS family)